MAENEKSVGSGTTATATVTSRTVTVVSTVGNSKKKIEVPTGIKWAELKSILGNQGYTLENMKAVEGAKKVTFEHNEAELPEGDFFLFLMPLKSKSGGELSRTDAYAKIKKFIDKDEELAKAHFNEGKNYTQKSTDVLNELIESYSPGTKKKVSADKAAAIADVVASVAGSSNAQEAKAAMEGLTQDEKIDVMIGVLVGMKSKSTIAGESDGDAVSEEVGEEAKPKETAEEKAEREEKERKAEEERIAKEKDEAETKQLMQQMGGLAEGFNDVDKRKLR